MIINVHAGHNPDGKIGCGAVGIMGESTMNREVVMNLCRMLAEAGHTVRDCTVNDGTSSSDVLKKIVSKCNEVQADLDVSIHHNACVKDFEGDGKTTGTEIYLYSMQSRARETADRVLERICSLGYRSNQGVIAKPGLHVLRHTKAPAMLVECCFCDDRDDVNIWDAYDMARAIACGIDPSIADFTDPCQTEPKEGGWYKVQVGAFKNKQNAEALLNRIDSLGIDAFIQEI